MTQPKSISQSTINVMGVDMIVHQLDTGERVIEADSVERFLDALGGPGTFTQEELAHIMAAIFPEASK